MIDVEEIQTRAAIALTSGNITPEIYHDVVELICTVQELHAQKGALIEFALTIESTGKNIEENTKEMLRYMV